MRSLKRAIEHPSVEPPAASQHSDRMLAFVIKAEAPPSRQLEDPFVGMYGEGLALEPTLDPERLLLLADENAAHSACLDAKADDATGRGWKLEPVKVAAPEPAAAETIEPGVEPTIPAAEKGQDAEAASQRLADLLEAITPEYTFSELLWQAAWERDAVGWSAWEVVRQGKNVAAIYPLPANTLRATKDANVFVQLRGGQVAYFRRFGSDANISRKHGPRDGEVARPSDTPGEDDATEVIVFRGYSARDPRYPIPRWVAAIPAIAELTAIREYNVSFYSSGGVVDRVIHVVAADETQAKALAEDINRQIDEAEGGTHLTITTGGSTGSDVKAVFLTPTLGRRDGQFGTRRAELTEEVLMAHKVPPYRVAKAITGALTGNGPSREMLHTYRTGTVEPVQDQIESRLNQTLFGPKGLDLKGYVWRLADLDWDETELDLNIATKAVDGGIASPNEGREILGFDKSDDPAMDGHYFKGVALGQPRSAQPPGPASPAFDALEALRARRAATPQEPAGTTPLEPVAPPSNGSTPPAEPAPVA
jgi:hypothetical protein